MKITKYPQSNLVIEKDGKKLVIDPGYPTFDQGFKIEEFIGADAYLITHIHRDHMDSKHIVEVVGNSPIYGNAEVAAALHFLGVDKSILSQVNIVQNKEKFNVAGFEIQALDLPHFVVGSGKPGPHNTGFLIDNIFFDPGDGIKINDLSVQNAAIPIAHPSITLEDSLKFAQILQAKVVIPIHYDVYEADTNLFIQTGKENNIEVLVLNPGQVIEI